MDSNINSDRTSHILNQWQVHQAEEQQQQQEVKQQVIKDQLTKYEISEAPQQATYTQDANAPKLADLAAKSEEAGQQWLNENKENGQQVANKLLTLGRAPGEETGRSVDEFTQENGNLDENALKQFAQQNNVDPGAARVAYFFAKNNPDEQLAPPFESVLQDVPQSPSNSAQKTLLKSTNFGKLLDSSGSKLQQLANKLGVTPEQAKELVNQAFVSGQSDDPDVQEFAQSLGDQADAQADDQIGNQTFNRALNGSSNSVNTLAQQLGKTPDEVKTMVLQAKSDPNADVPPEVKNLAQQTQAQADQLSQEPTVDPQAEFTNMLNDSTGPGADQVKYLSQQLGVSEDQVKQMLQTAAKDPNADVPPEILRAAGTLMEKATGQGMDKATAQAAGKIFDAKVALGGDKITALAKKLGLSEDQVKALLQKALTDPEGVPPEIAQLAEEMMGDAEAQATLLLADQPTGEEMDSMLNKELDSFFEQAMTKMGLSQQIKNKMIFAKENPQLGSQLDPDIQDATQKLLASAKASLQSTFGVPQSHENKSLTTSLTNSGTALYDELFEGQLDGMQTNGELNDQDVAQLRQLHYYPSANAAASDKIKQLFQQIEGDILPQIRAQLGAPDSWSPKPGLDRFNAVANGELGYNIDKALKELKNNGTISSDQLKQIQKQLSGGAQAPQELQELIATLMKGGIQAVIAKYGISAQSMNVDAPLSSGKVAPDISATVKNSLQMADEATDNFEANIKQAKGSPLSPLYVDYLKISREMLSKCKEFLYMMTAGDGQRAKNMAVTELSKQMNRLEQMKRSFEKRDEALEKMAGMKILMIFLMIIMAVIMIILAVVLIGGIVGLIIAIIIAIMEIINIALTATDSPAAEAWGYVTMVVEFLLAFVQAALEGVKSAVKSIIKIIQTMMKQGIGKTLKGMVKAVTKEAIKEAINELINQLIDMVLNAISPVLGAMKDLMQGAAEGILELLKAIVTVIMGLLKGSASEAGQALMKGVDGTMKVAPEMVKGTVSQARMMRMAQMSEPSTSYADMMGKLARRVLERAMIAFENFVKAGAKAARAFREEVDAIATEIAQFCRTPVESSKAGWQSFKSSANDVVDALNVRTTKDVLDDAGNVVGKKTNWMNDLNDPTFMSKEGAQLNSKMKMILGTGEALTQGTQSLAGGIRDDALAESEAIMLELEGFLQQTAEMIKFIRKCIDKLVAGISEPLAQIKSISESQAKFWKDLSGVSTGLAQSLQG